MNLPDKSIRVMTSNVRLKNNGDGIDIWDNRKNNLFNLINFHGAELIGMQEVLHPQLVDISLALPHYSYVGIGREDGKEVGEYAAIFFLKERFELLDNGHFWLSETPNVVGSKGWDAVCVRIATWVKLHDKKTDSAFFMLNTHFDHVGTVAMEESAKLINNFVEQNSNGIPFIVTGDFNCVKNTTPYNIITQKLNDCGANSYGPSISFHSFIASEIFFNNYMGDSSKLKETGIIDFIFSSKNIKTIKHGVISDSFDGFYPSDHFPVVADILLP